MEKVYCKNCKHNGGLLNICGWSWCEGPHLNKNKFNSIDYIGVPIIKRKSEFKKTFNEDGECPYYERVWYKFWIKNK
jgi:hypothetical protein